MAYHTINFITDGFPNIACRYIAPKCDMTPKFEIENTPEVFLKLIDFLLFRQIFVTSFLQAFEISPEYGSGSPQATIYAKIKKIENRFTSDRSKMTGICKNKQ